MEACVPFFVSMEHIAVVLQQNIETLGLIVSNCREKGCWATFISSFYQIVYGAKFTQKSWNLLVAIAHTMMKGISSPLVFDAKVTLMLYV